MLKVIFSILLVLFLGKNILADCLITFIQNEGFKFTSGTKTLFVDAFLEYGGMNAGEVEDADIIFVTHNHGDHFHADSVAKVANNTGAKVVGDSNVIRDLQSMVPSTQLILVHPAPEESTAMSVEDIYFVAYHDMAHSNCYFITINDICIFHEGDHDGFNPPPQNSRVDVALIMGIDPNEMVDILCLEYPRAQYFVGMHLSPDTLAICYSVKDSSSWNLYKGDTLRIYKIGIEEKKTLNYTDFAINIVPNPISKDKGEISYIIPSSVSFVSLDIYDISGREVWNMKNEKATPGVYKIPWAKVDNQGKRLGSGVYFIRLKMDNKTVLSKKLLLVK